MARGRLAKNIQRKHMRLAVRQEQSLEEIAALRVEVSDLAEGLRRQRLSLPVHSDFDTMLTSVILIIHARISFRAVPRVLGAMGWKGWLPHFTSVINWVCRVGLATLQHVKSPNVDWVAIIDMTLDVAFKKALVVLRLPLSIYVERNGAVTLDDVTCAGVVVRDSWKSEDVKEALQGILAGESRLRAIIKDGGTDLAKGIRLWKESEKRADVFSISDISHEVGNALKADFKDRPTFKMITKKLKDNATKIFQPRLAFLAPPKLRPKGRFMGISRLGNWLEKIQKLLGGLGRVHEGSLASELRRVFGGVGTLNYMMRQLCQRSIKLAEVMDVLKANGLNQSSYRQSMAIIEQLPPRSHSRKRIAKWLKRHLHIQCRLGIGQTGLPVSSDIIESLFGTFKGFIARDPKAELNHLILAIPALCGIQNHDTIRSALANVSHADFIAWRKREIGTTSRMLRRCAFSEEGLADLMTEMGRTKHA